MSSFAELKRLKEDVPLRCVYLSPQLYHEFPASIEDQIRVKFVDGRDGDETDEFLFSIGGIRPSTSDRAEIWIPAQQLEQLDGVVDTGLAEKNCILCPFAPNPDIDSIKEAFEKREFIEHAVHPTQNTDVFVQAPHGGKIEPGTAEQATDLILRTGSAGWMTYGFGQAFRRWHVTSNIYSYASFPEYSALTDYDFEYAVSFHGHGYDHIGIGGLCSESVKEELASVLQDRIAENGIGVEVRVLEPTDELNGMKEWNVVNRAAENGIQLEQPRGVRENHGEVVVDAVEEVLF